MYQRALSEVVLRILGITYLYGVLQGIATTGFLAQAYSYIDAIGVSALGLLAASGVFFGIQVLISLALVIGAKPISKMLFKEEERVFDRAMLSVEVFVRSLVPVMGLYILFINLPSFVTTAYGRFAERVDANPLLVSQYGVAMVEGTIEMLLAGLMIFKSRFIARCLLAGPQKGRENIGKNLNVGS